MDAMSPEECERLAAGLQADPEAPRTPFGPGSATRVIAIASGKGGVGKSTVTANIAVALAMHGHAVGLIDADVYGPTIPLMFGMAHVAPESHDGKLVPPERHGVSLVSMGFFLQDDEPVVWRGPMLGRAMEQFLGDVLWGSPDYLLIDLPPGTGDIALTVAQMLPAAEIVVVTTPQEAAAKSPPRPRRWPASPGTASSGSSRTWRTSSVRRAAPSITSSARAEPSRSRAPPAPRLLGRIPFDEATRSAGDDGAPPALDPRASRGRLRDIAVVRRHPAAPCAGALGRPPSAQARRARLSWRTAGA